MERSGLDAMVDADKLDSLSRLYRMFIKVSAGLPSIRRSVKDSIIRRGKELNLLNAGGSDELSMDVEVDGDTTKGKGKLKARPTGQQTLNLALKWVQDVLDLKDKFDHVWKHAFNSDRDLESGINEVKSSYLEIYAFPHFPNRHSNLSST